MQRLTDDRRPSLHNHQLLMTYNTESDASDSVRIDQEPTNLSERDQLSLKSLTLVLESL